MRVYQLAEPHAQIPRSHPWTRAVDNPAHRYLDLRQAPERIRLDLEDLRPWDHFAAVQRWYGLLEWLNGSDSIFESSDCAFSGPSAEVSQGCGKALECSGRLTILFRNLRANLGSEATHLLAMRCGNGLVEVDPGFEHGAVGLSELPVRYLTLPGPAHKQAGHQLLLSVWAWGDDEAELMGNLDRIWRNLSQVLRSIDAKAA